MRKLLLMCALVTCGLWGQAQQLIVNEVSQGPTGNGPNGTERAYVELLVVGTRTCTKSTMDLRGWIVDDNNGWVKSGAGTGIAPGAIRFANSVTWQNVPYGSIILIYNDNDKNAAITLPNDPTDANGDNVYVVPASSNVMERHLTVPAPPSITPAGYSAGGWGFGTPADAWSTVALRNGGDAILTVNPAVPNAAAFSFAYGDIGPGAVATIYVPDMDGGKNYFLTDANYTQAASWQQGDVGVNETPGVPNGGANTTWITGMRQPVTGLTVDPIVSSNGSTFCVGSSTTLSSTTAGGTWTIAPAGAATVSAAGVVTAIAPGTATVTYTVTSSGCTGTADFAITVTAAANAGTVSGGPNLCVGASSTYSSNGTAGGTWSSANPAIATVNPATGAVTAVAPGTTNIIYTVGTGACQATAQAPVTVTATGNAGAVSGGPGLCTGTTATYSSNGNPGGTWSSGNTGIATVDPVTGVVTAVAAGSTSITYTVGTGACQATASAPVTVTQTPVLQPTTGNNLVCSGGTVTLTNPAINGTGTWSSSNAALTTLTPSAVAGGPSTVIVTALGPGTVTINFTVTQGGCSSTVPFVLTINPVPVVAPITGNNTACLGTSTTFSDATPGGTWASSNTGVATISAAGVISTVSVGTVDITYTVTVGGCTGTATKSFSVSPLPVVGPNTGTATVCVGSATTLSNPATGVSTWTSSNAAVVTVVGGVVTGVSAGTADITFTVMNAEGCTASATTTVTVTAIPVVTPILGGGNLCSGTTTNLTNATPGGTWTSSNTAVATVSTTGVVTGVSTGAATITYTVGSGTCSASANVTINVQSTPAPAAITGNPSVCPGGTTTLANATPGGVWSSQNATIAAVSATGVVTGVANGTTQIVYTVTTNGCTGVATINVTVAPLVVADITGNPSLCLGSSSTLASATPGGTWTSSNAGVATISATGAVTAVSAGTSTISYTVTNGGCTGSRTATVTVASCVRDVFVPNYFTPNNDGRNDVLYIYGTVIAALDFRIFNQWGEQVFATTDKGRGWDGITSGKAQPVGVYMYAAQVTLTSGEKITLKGSINLIR